MSKQRCDTTQMPRGKSLLSRVAPIALLLAVSGTSAHAQLVNGSFETGNFTGTNPNGSANQTQLFTGATNITGWTVIDELAWLANGNPSNITASD